MDSKFKFTDKAENDLDEILDYISNKLCNFQAANDLFNKVFNNIIAFPLCYPLLENEYVRNRNTRKAIIDNYNLYYVIESNTIVVLRIIDNKRDLSELINIYNQPHYSLGWFYILSTRLYPSFGKRKAYFTPI
jgi:plasmid stabilization system protein ParE